MLECPIDYFTDNLVFNRDKSCWAFFELHGYDYDMLSAEKKIGILNALTKVIANVHSYAQILIIPVVQDLDDRFSALKKGVVKNDPLYNTAIRQADLTKEYLQQSNVRNGRANNYRTFISFKLQKSDETEVAEFAKDVLGFLIRSIINDFNAFMKLDGKDIMLSKIYANRRMAKEIYEDQKKRIALSPTDTKTTQWLFRRVLYRGMKQEVRLFQRSTQEAWKPNSSVIEIAQKKYLRPRSSEVVNLFSGTIRKKERTLIIEHENGTSYQTFLPITNIPDDELLFPDCEWIYLLQQCGQQAEIVITIKAIEHREAIKKIEDQRKAANSQVENIEKANFEVPQDLWESKQQIDQIEQDLKNSRNPLIHTSITICLAADNQEELEGKANYVKSIYEDMNFIIERPLTDQLDLFMQCIPSVGFCVTDFILKMTPVTLASGLIGATHELGDADGGYIGTTGVEQKNVFFNMKNACLSNMSACATLFGNLGVGKSFNANLLLYLHVLYLGAYGLIWDPKGERTHWVHQLKALEGMITIVTLSSKPEYIGTLDPYNIFRDDINEASELAMNILTELLKINQKAEDTVLTEAIEKNKSVPLPSMQSLEDILDNFDPKDELYSTSKMMARQMRGQKKIGMSQLLFGNGTEKAITLNNRLNILQVQNLKLPEKNKEKKDYTREETVSAVVMDVGAAFSRRFLHSHPNHLKVLLYDESWMIGKTPEGEKLISYGSRMSRSLFASIILNGHSVTDIPNEGIRNAITYKFCFKTDNPDEAIRMLEYMKLEVTQDNINLIMNLGNAQCLFQDLRGRVGVLQFDAVFQDLIDVFSTTPVDASALEQTDGDQLEPVMDPVAEEVEPEQAGNPEDEAIQIQEDIIAAEAQDDDFSEETTIDLSSIDIFAYEK